MQEKASEIKWCIIMIIPPELSGNLNIVNLNKGAFNKENELSTNSYTWINKSSYEFKLIKSIL